MEGEVIVLEQHTLDILSFVLSNSPRSIIVNYMFLRSANVSNLSE